MAPVTGSQIKAARALLGWSLSDLSERAGASPSVLSRIESSGGRRPPPLTRAVGALEAAGVRFERGGAILQAEQING